MSFFGKILTGVGGVTLYDDIFGSGGSSSSGGLVTSILLSPTLWEIVLVVGGGFFVFRVAERKIDRLAFG